MDLAATIVVYFLSSLGGVSVVKFLNYHFCFTSWMVLALLSRSTWTLAFLLHVALRFRDNNFSQVASWIQLRLYCLIALGLSIVELLNSLSMSVLPGSLYALLKGTDVGWSMLLSRCLLQKSYNSHQMLGAILIVGGTALVFLLRGFGSTPSETRSSHVNVPTAATLCVLGAFFNALCSVITEGALKKTIQQEERRIVDKQLANEHREPSRLLQSNAYAMFTSLFSFGILASVIGARALLFEESNSLPLTLSFSCDNEEEDDTSFFMHAPEASSTQTAGSVPRVAILFLFLVTFTRFAERLSKHYICVRDSAMTFSVVQAARRLSGVFILALAFGEHMSRPLLAGAACSGAGFVLHWYGGQQERGTPERLQANGDRKGNTYELVSTTIRSPDEDAAGGGSDTLVIDDALSDQDQIRMIPSASVDTHSHTL